jgi:hypothetical protein
MLFSRFNLNLGGMDISIPQTGHLSYTKGKMDLEDKIDYYKRNRGATDPDIIFKNGVISIISKQLKQYEYILWMVLMGALPVILLLSIERDIVLYVLCFSWILWLTYTFFNTIRGENNVQIFQFQKVIRIQSHFSQEKEFRFDEITSLRLRTKYFGGRMAPKGRRITLCTQQKEYILIDIGSYDLGDKVGDLIAETTGIKVEE